MPPYRVVIAEDHPIVRAGIRDILQQQADIIVVGEAPDGSQAIELVRELAPDVLLLDIELPLISGIEVAELLRKNDNPTRILALSAHTERYFVDYILGHGACGYLVKDESVDLVVDAVRAVAQGETGWISESISASKLSWARDGSQLGKKLSRREQEVLKRLTEGMTNQQIAMDLRISSKTVEKYIDRIYSKLGVSSRVEAAVYSTREGLVPHTGRSH